MFQNICIIFLIFSTSLSMTLSQTIRRCHPEKQIEFPQDVGGGVMDGYINAQLDFYRQKNVIFVENMTFDGYVKHNGHPTLNLSMVFNTIMAVRVQHSIEYKYNGSEELVSSFCNLGFIENDKRLPVPRIVEENILRIAEDCIEKVACDFDPNNHKMGDDIHVKSRPDDMFKSDVTSQETLNAAIDILLEKSISRLIEANQTVIRFPAFNISTTLKSGLLPSSLFFNSSGGYVDILKYISRAEDFTFLNVGRRFIFNLALTLSAGIAALNNMTFISSLSAPIEGNITINMTDTTLWLQVALDHTENPCHVVVDRVAINTRGRAANFSELTIRPTSLGGKLAATGISVAMRTANRFKSWWSSPSRTTTTEGSTDEEPTTTTTTTTTARPSSTSLNADELLNSIPGSKQLIVSALTNQLGSFIKKSIESIPCKEHKAKYELQYESAALISDGEFMSSTSNALSAGYLLVILSLGKFLYSL